MRASTISIFLQLGTLAVAQNLSGLPVCAQTAAAVAAGNSGCGLTDASCLCMSAGFIASLKATISGSCTGSDQQTACAWGNTACSTYGVSIDCSAYSAGSSGSGMTASPAAQMQSSAMVASTSTSGTASMASTASSATGMGSMATASSMMMSTGMMGATMTSSMTSSMPSSMMTMSTSTMAANDTMMCTHSCGNMTMAATSMVSRTASAPTSLYTGSANTAARHCGVIGVLVGITSLLLIF